MTYNGLKHFEVKPAPELTKGMYLVGGAVRDLVMNTVPRDYDYVATGFTAEELEAEGFIRIDASFPVFLSPDDKSEIALARREKSTGDGYNDFTVFTNNVTLEEDLKRRDLTMNSMALDGDKKIIDPFGGLDDIKRKLIRHTSDAFFEDPLRVLRLARTQAKYPDFKIHKDTIKLVRENKHKLRALTPERVLKEMYKVMELDYPSMYFRTLDFLGVLDLVHPELYAMKQCIQKPQYHAEGDVFLHSMMVLEECCALTKDIHTRISAMYHDIAKPICDIENLGIHNGHDSLDVVHYSVQKLKSRYKMSNKLVRSIQIGAMYHMRLHKLKEMQSSSIASMFNDPLFPKNKEELMLLLYVSSADARGRRTIGFAKEDINVDAIINTYTAIKHYSPETEIKQITSEKGSISVEHIKQLIHKYSIKCVNTWLKPALNTRLYLK